MFSRVLQILRRLAAGQDPVPPPLVRPSQTLEQMLDEWEHAQGVPGAQHSAVYLAALREIAERVARQALAEGRARDSVRLTPEQMTIARVRAVHRVRLVKFGPLPDDVESWWDQVEQTARHMRLNLERPEWEAYRGFPYPRSRGRA